MKKNQMQYKNLGRSGLKVSRFSYGNFLTTPKGMEEEHQQLVNSMIKLSFEKGINFFDTAEAYDAGEAERKLGKALKALNVPRSDYVVSTKIYWGRHSSNSTDVNNVGTSRKHLYEGLERSLANLQLDYVDVLFCHRYDNETTTEEVVQAMRDIIASGQALYWATSTWPADRIMEAILLSDIHGAPRPICDQCQYSMLHRGPIEKEYINLFDSYGYGTTVYSTLKFGILTGKYNESIPEDSRLSRHKVSTRFLSQKGEVFSPENKASTIDKLRKLAVVAKKVGCTQTQLSLVWTLHSKDVTTAILGARNCKQLAENIDAIRFYDKLTPEILEEIEGILQNRPTPETDYKNNFALMPYRR